MKTFIRRSLMSSVFCFAAAGMANQAHATNGAGVLWRNGQTGELSVWEVATNGSVTGTHSFDYRCKTPNCQDAAPAVATGLFTRGSLSLGSPSADVLFYDTNSGQLFDIYHYGTPEKISVLTAGCAKNTGCSPEWKFVGTGKFGPSGDGGILWQDIKTGVLSAWQVTSDGYVLPQLQELSWKCGPDCLKIWKSVATGDLNNDGHTDVLWHNPQTGQLQAWLVGDGGLVVGAQTLSTVCGPGCASDWSVVGLEDFNVDGNQDILWYNAGTGALSAWLLDGYGNVKSFLSLSWNCGYAYACNSIWKPIGTVSNRSYIH